MIASGLDRGTRLAVTGLCLAAVASLSGCKPRPASDASSETQSSSYAGIASGVIDKVQSDYLASKPRDAAWFLDSPLGWNGVPLIVLKGLILTYPEVWGTTTPMPLHNLGLGYHPADYTVEGTLVPPQDRRSLPFGMAWVENRGVPKDVATDNVFFTCAGCHTAKIRVDNKIRFVIGAPSSTIEAQMYAERLVYSAERVFEGFNRGAPPDMTKVKPRDAELKKIAANLKAQFQKDPTFFYGGRTDAERHAGVARAEQQLKLLENRAQVVVQSFLSSAARAQALYYIVAKGTSFRDNQIPAAPPIFGPRPGQMDAFGVASGLVFLHLQRRDPQGNPDLSFLAKIEKEDPNHPFFQGVPPGLAGPSRLEAAKKNMLATWKTWVPQRSGVIDIKALFKEKEQEHANWDANQGNGARVIASGLSSVGDPAQVDVEIHTTMNDFINELPAPPFPGSIDQAAATRGARIYQKNCVECHRPNNPEVYDVGTDPNRANQISPTVRLGFIALIRETCKDWQSRIVNTNHRVATGLPADGCMPNSADRAKLDENLYRSIRQKPGYQGESLVGIWAQAPYLHNGSVPTLWHLLRPSQRPSTFIRGNINFDKKFVGYKWDRAPLPGSYGPEEPVHAHTYDTSLSGQSNKGHTYGQELSDRDAWDLVEYMKTL